MKFKAPRLYFIQALPDPRKIEVDRSLVIFDRILLRNRKVRSWLRKCPHKYSVKAGESLKDIKNFPGHIEKILKATGPMQKGPLQIIAVGGGSVGDFAGFVASILKRGVDLVHIPSTWLSAIDSAHGGKTALNVSQIKNQIGSFHQAREIYLVQSLLFLQPEERIQEALGEAVKIALISGGDLWKKFQQVKRWNRQVCWKLLKQMIQAKYDIVKKDPLETKGLRHVLNLGHTMGHVFESAQHIPHGRAVLLGLRFSWEWSLYRGMVKPSTQAEFEQGRIYKAFPTVDQHVKILKGLKNPQRALLADKKRAKSGKIRFIFFVQSGRVLVHEVSVWEICDEIQRQIREQSS